ENLGMIEYEQQVKGNIDYVTKLQNVDYAAFAESCGAKGIKVTKAEELAPAFHEALHSDQPVVVDVMIGNEPPLPGKITYGQAKGFSKYMLKNFFENQKIEMPSLKKSLKRLF
ncbi:thiamine pyrophosphate-dependent enzyme, partial [Bacillus subtilis]